ncbi:DUF2834 domain-containing protein [bacterium]|nr:DUF2834 domain-containing protein [bacterium]
MKFKQSTFYLWLLIATIAIALIATIPLLQEPGGFDVARFVRDATVNNSARFIGIDLSLAVSAFIPFMYFESKRIGLKRWALPLIGMFTVGACVVFPWFLYRRAKHLKI